ncbi:MAG TPA: L-lactate permease, partial [Savagea sp.]
MFGIATIAITAPLFFLIILRIDALRSMFYSLLLVSGSAYFIWGMESEAVAASSVQGMYKATYIVVILFGATILVHL